MEVMLSMNCVKGLPGCATSGSATDLRELEGLLSTAEVSGTTVVVFCSLGCPKLDFRASTKLAKPSAGEKATSVGPPRIPEPTSRQLTVK